MRNLVVGSLLWHTIEAQGLGGLGGLAPVVAPVVAPIAAAPIAIASVVPIPVDDIPAAVPDVPAVADLPADLPAPGSALSDVPAAADLPAALPVDLPAALPAPEDIIDNVPAAADLPAALPVPDSIVPDLASPESLFSAPPSPADILANLPVVNDIVPTAVVGDVLAALPPVDVNSLAAVVTGAPLIAGIGLDQGLNLNLAGGLSSLGANLLATAGLTGLPIIGDTNVIASLGLGVIGLADDILPTSASSSSAASSSAASTSSAPPMSSDASSSAPSASSAASSSSDVYSSTTEVPSSSSEDVYSSTTEVPSSSSEDVYSTTDSSSMETTATWDMNPIETEYSSTEDSSTWVYPTETSSEWYYPVESSSSMEESSTYMGYEPEPTYEAAPWSGEDNSDYDGEDYGYDEECPAWCLKDDKSDDYKDTKSYDEDDTSYSSYLKRFVSLFRRAEMPSSSGGFASFLWPQGGKGDKKEEDCDDDIPDWLYDSTGKTPNPCKPKCPKSCYDKKPDYPDKKPYPTKDTGYSPKPYESAKPYEPEPYKSDDSYDTPYTSDDSYEPYKTPDAYEPYKTPDAYEPYKTSDSYEPYKTPDSYEPYTSDDSYEAPYTTEEGYAWPTEKPYQNASTPAYGMPEEVPTTLATVVVPSTPESPSTDEAPAPAPAATDSTIADSTLPENLPYTGDTLVSVCPKQCNPFDPLANKCDITSSCTTTGYSKYYCACRAGFRASAWNPKDFSKQFRFKGQPYVYTGEGVVCDTVCTDTSCSEVLERPQCQ